MKIRKLYVFRYYFHNRMLTDSLVFRANSREEADIKLDEYFKLLQPVYYAKHPEKFTPKRVVQRSNMPKEKK